MTTIMVLEKMGMGCMLHRLYVSINIESALPYHKPTNKTSLRYQLAVFSKPKTLSSFIQELLIDKS